MTDKTGGITGKGFVKGDPRINRKGRPKSFDALRTLAQQVAHEAALVGGEPLVLDGHVVSVAEAILRQWAQSRNWQLQRQFMEVAFGKTPETLHVSGADGNALKVIVEYANIPYPVTDISPEPGGDST